MTELEFRFMIEGFTHSTPVLLYWVSHWESQVRDCEAVIRELRWSR